MRTGKKGRLAEVSWTLPSWIWEFWRGRSPGRWNQQHWLWRDGWPCQHDIAIEKFISGTELEPCMQEEEQLISKNTAAYIAADHSPEADVKILDSAFVVQMLSHRTSLSRTTATASFCLTFLDNFRVFNGYYLGCLSHRLLEGQDKKQTGGQGQHLCCWRNKGGRAVGCIWDWKTFQIHCNPGKYWCRQIKSFACLSHCNWLWHSLSLWLERKTEAWNTWTAFPTMASAFLET